MFERIVRLLCGALLCALLPVAMAAYPERPIRLLIPQTPGTATDIHARKLAEFLSKELKVPVVPDNRAGANGVPAAVAIKNAAPDGYTLMMSLPSQTLLNPFLYKNIGYDGLRDFAFVAPVTEFTYVIVASKKSGITSFEQLVNEARRNPGKFTFSSPGVGNFQYLGLELIWKNAGIRLVHVPYNGSAASQQAVLTGEVDVALLTTSTTATQIEADRLTPLVVSAPSKFSERNKIRTFKDFNIDVPVPAWIALVGPKDLPPEIIKVLEGAVIRYKQQPETLQFFLNSMVEASPGGSAVIRNRVENEKKIWGDFMRENNVQPQ